MRPLLNLPHITPVHDEHNAPEQIPIYVHDFLKVCLGLKTATVTALWEALCHLVWKVEYNQQLTDDLGSKYIPLFLRHGDARGIGTSSSIDSVGLLSLITAHAVSILPFCPTHTNVSRPGMSTVPWCPSSRATVS
jgi:hypothetical protein